MPATIKIRLPMRLHWAFVEPKGTDKKAKLSIVFTMILMACENF